MQWRFIASDAVNYLGSCKKGASETWISEFVNSTLDPPRWIFQIVSAIFNSQASCNGQKCAVIQAPFLVITAVFLWSFNKIPFSFHALFRRIDSDLEEQSSFEMLEISSKKPSKFSDVISGTESDLKLPIIKSAYNHFPQSRMNFQLMEKLFYSA